MTSVNIYNQTGEVQGKVDLNPKIFSVEKINSEMVHQVVVGMLANERNTVASTKTRGEVRGGGKKPWQQKGTGRARAGSSRSPLWVGGGITFGPRSNRNFSKAIPKKMKTAALFMGLSDKVKNEKLIVLDDLQVPSGKTRDFAALLKVLSGKISSLGKKILLVVPKKDDSMARAGKNLNALKIIVGQNMNVMDVLSADCLVVLKSALPVIEKTYLKG